MDYNRIGDLAISLIVAAGLKSSTGVAKIVNALDTLTFAKEYPDILPGTDNRSVDLEELREKHEQRILKGY